MVSFNFGRELRLLSGKEFSHVFAQPLRVTNQAFTLLARANHQQNPRLGLAIAKKQVKLAVDRNLIKRKLRNSFRLQRQQLPPYDFVVMVRREINQMDRRQIQAALDHLWRKATKVCKTC